MWKEEGPTQEFLLLCWGSSADQRLSQIPRPPTPLLCSGQVFVVQKDWQSKQPASAGVADILGSSLFWLSVQGKHLMHSSSEIFRLFYSFSVKLIFIAAMSTQHLSKLEPGVCCLTPSHYKELLREQCLLKWFCPGLHEIYSTGKWKIQFFSYVCHPTETAFL